LPSERSTTSPGAPPSGATLAVGVVSAKASSTTSQPPRRARRACQSSRRARPKCTPVGLFGCTSTTMSLCSIAASIDSVATARGRRGPQAAACSA